MLFMIFSLICLFLTNFFIQSTTCAVSTNTQNLELDDITSLWDKLPSIIDKIKEAVNRFRCPKGWKRLGGSCYYLSNLTSTNVNYTCNFLHSNLSNLIQIRNAVELFYAKHVLSRNNWSSLMIDIHPNLLKGKKISEMLMNDEGRWERMKGKFHEIRVKYQKFIQKIVNRLSSNGLRILRRSKKIKQIPPKQEFIHDEFDPDQYDQYEFDDKESNITNLIFLNQTIINVSSIINNHDDEYEYDDLDSSDESDEFEQIQDIRGICQQIDWNVLNNNSTVFILTTYKVSDKIVCSLSDVDPNTEYHYICEYVLNFCFANIVCGEHGQCVNTLTGFKCSCSFLYGGLLCEKISEHGRQIIISIVIIIILTILSFKPIRSLLWFIIELLMHYYKKYRNKRRQKKQDTIDDRERLVTADRSDNDGRITDGHELQQANKTLNPKQRRQTIVQKIMESFLPKTPNPLLNPIKRNLVRNIWVGCLSIFILSLLFVITTIMYLMSFGYNITDDKEEFSINDTLHLVTQCEHISNHRIGNLIFFPFALSLILIFSWSIKRETLYLDKCDGRPGLLPPIEPFRTGNRFTTATVFGILAFEVLKVFEELLFNTGQPLRQGVLIELLERIGIIILVGLRYYPVLASLQLRNIVARFFAFLYIICDIVYTIVREGSCMGYLPLSGHYTALEEAKLRKELGTWFIIYGLIKNIPHFFFLSYIGAELCVRFIYDSIYVPLKKKQSIWSAPVVELDESEFAKYYVTKLFRRHHPLPQTTIQQNTNVNNLVDYEYEAEQQNKAKQSRLKKFIKFIYHSDDDFRFTTIAMCTYTVAVVFLYYLACTVVFLYISRTTGHILFIKFYIESTFNVDLGTFSLGREIIVSAVLTVIIYGFQLLVGMQNYKKHKKQLYKGIFVDIPSAVYFKPSSIASNSVHYSGFLVGYMAWGFIICFHLIFFILIGIRILSLQIAHIEIALGIIVPILVIYLLKMIGVTSLGKFLFIQRLDNKLNLRSRKTYAIFVYFSFFADCFLGIASCIIRLIKATVLNVVFMARLDWSFLGRPLEKFDIGFAAYISYLHMEVAHTNPVMLAFCYSLYDDIVQRRSKRPYHDECCIAPSELDDENGNETARQTQVQHTRTNLRQTLPSVRYRRENNNDELIQDNSNPNVDEPISKRTSQTQIEQHLQDLSVIKIVPKTESPNPSIIFTKENQKNIGSKKKPQQSNIANEEKHSNASTIVQLIPQQQLPLGPAPKIPRRQDLSSEQDESEDEIDDDGGLKLKSFSTIEKIIPQQQQPRLTSLPQSSKINTDNRTDEDGGISKQKILAAEKKKQQNIIEDSDDGVPKCLESKKKKNSRKPKKDISKSKIVQEEDEDKDGGRIVKTYDTIKKILPSKQPILDNRLTKEESSSDDSDDGTMRSSKRRPDTILTSQDTIGRIVPKISDNIRNIKSKKTKDKHHYDIVPTEEEHATQTTTFFSPPSHNLATNPADLYHLRTISYREAQHRSPPFIPHQSGFFTTLRNHDNTNDDSSHYSEITDDTTRSSVSNRFYSNFETIQASSKHSDKQQISEEQKQDEDINVETEGEEEEKQEQEEVHLLNSRPTSLPNETTVISTINTSSKSEEDNEIERIKKRKRLRFRWHFLYTILRNYHLFDLRKGVQGRLTRLHIQRSNLMDEQQFATTIKVEEPETAKLMAESGTRAKGLVETFQLDIPTPIERRPPLTQRFLSVPVSLLNDLPESPAERYIAIRAQMLYDVNVQQPNTPYTTPISKTPTTVSVYNQQLRPPMTTTFSDHSLGFHTSPNIIVPPPSERSLKAEGKRTTNYPTSRVSQQENITPSLFQPVSASNQSTADYPLAGSSIVNSSTLCTQMSHDQCMQVWRQGQVEKIQKKQRHCYIYGQPPQTPIIDKVSTAAILTPQICSTTTKQQQVPPTPNQRGPTVSPFQFPPPPDQMRSASSSIISDTQSKTNNQKPKINRQQKEIPILPQRMDRLDEDPQETSNANKSLKIASALIHQEDSESSTMDITET